MRRLIALLLVGGCASAGQPPGGPERHTPPEIVSITPDSGETNVKDKVVEFRFDEVVSDRSGSGGGMLDGLFLVSPRTGAPNVSWHRSRITVRPKGGFRANTAYSVTMLPGIVDLHNNVLKVPTTVVFATGTTFPKFDIPGRVFDWSAQHVAPGAYIEATLKTDTTLVYIAATDSAGQFDVGPLPEGTYSVRALIDQNNNRMLDRNEKWDSITTVA
ncbi:MAG TPA: Ig-like domain-containing protein, partial [Gemmatimonadaceae bacterium]|nr:Ig-like domain-containing protein [Gemmatimonadaceae bacterium]